VALPAASVTAVVALNRPPVAEKLTVAPDTAAFPASDTVTVMVDAFELSLLMLDGIAEIPMAAGTLLPPEGGMVGTALLFPAVPQPTSNRTMSPFMIMFFIPVIISAPS
jgi:hypothetical protein